MHSESFKHILVVGQGIAGTLLSYELYKREVPFTVVNPNYLFSSSKVAAGIINPITGRRFVKSWKVDELLTKAKQVYAELSVVLESKLFEEVPIQILFYETEELNNAMARVTDEDLLPHVSFINSHYDETAYSSVLGTIEIKSSLRVYLDKILELWQEFLLRKKKSYEFQPFQHKELIIFEDHLKYKGSLYSDIVFCEGAAGRFNPYFNYLEFWPTKGDILWLEIPGLELKDKIIKNGIFIVPLGNQLFWVGSTYRKTFENDEPSAFDKDEILENLERFMKLPYQVIKHISGIRPTVRDRKPYLGSHPKYKKLHIFNGLGAKGSSLAPYFAEMMAEYLVEGKPISSEVSIDRLKKKYQEISS